MKITNVSNLPQVFVDFARDDKYDKGRADISVTTLIDAPRVNVLRQQRHLDTEVDVADMIWPLFGTAVHHILDSGPDDPAITKEERLFVDIAGWTVSGAVDHQEERDGVITITDYKVTSVWSVIFSKQAWVDQLNCYAQMVRVAKGKPVRAVRICAILRDWSRRDAQFKSDYPKLPVVILTLDLWSPEKAAAYMLDRVTRHQEAQMIFDLGGGLPDCSDEERWTKPTSYAVMKKGAVRATRVFDNPVDAEAHAEGLNVAKPLYSVVLRPGERTRCEGYCAVSDFCTQYQTEKLEKDFSLE